MVAELAIPRGIEPVRSKMDVTNVDTGIWVPEMRTRVLPPGRDALRLYELARELRKKQGRYNLGEILLLEGEGLGVYNITAPFQSDG